MKTKTTEKETKAVKLTSTGTIELKLGNRPDGVPFLKLEAFDKEGRTMLARMMADLEKARLFAVSSGNADIYNVCGSRGNDEEIYSMSIPLALGGIGLQIRADLHPAKKKATGK